MPKNKTNTKRTAAKITATEPAVKKEICQLEEKLTYDRKLHRNLVKSETGLRRLISKEEARLGRLKGWKGDGTPPLRIDSYSIASSEMMAIAFSLGATLLEGHIRREIFGTKASRAKG